MINEKSHEENQNEISFQDKKQFIIQQNRVNTQKLAKNNKQFPAILNDTTKKEIERQLVHLKGQNKFKEYFKLKLEYQSNLRF